jgi:hypothetical protein
VTPLSNIKCTQNDIGSRKRHKRKIMECKKLPPPRNSFSFFSFSFFCLSRWKIFWFVPPHPTPHFSSWLRHWNHITSQNMGDPIFTSCASLVVVLSRSNREVVSSTAAHTGRVKPKTFKIGSDCSLAKSTAFRSENHVQVFRIWPLKRRPRVAVGVARKRTLTAKSHTC